MSHALESVALALVSEGKGILAVDETVPTLTKRFAVLAIQSTLAAGQRAFHHHARLNGAASVGMYMGEIEAGSPGDEDPPHRDDWGED